MTSAPSAAAFVRLEGVLIGRGGLSAAAYLAANAQGLRERAMRIGHVAAAAALHAALGQNDRSLSTRFTWASIIGVSEDRAQILADEYVREQIEPRLLASGLELITRCRKEGLRVVLFSELPDVVAAPIARLIRGTDELVCNRLELRDGVVTGRLLDPLIGGHDGGAWVRAWCGAQRVEAGRCWAYGSVAPDATLLATVGRPCAVNPDFTLRRAAVEARWPVLDYRA